MFLLIPNIYNLFKYTIYRIIFTLIILYIVVLDEKTLINRFFYHRNNFQHILRVPDFFIFDFVKFNLKNLFFL